MNEFEFTAAVASWINEIIGKNSRLPFSEARCEQTSKSSRKRRDLSLLDSNNRIALTGEVKLPYQKDGTGPYNDKVINDARSKAQRAGARFFFTWNVNDFILWQTEPTKKLWREHNYKSWEVTKVHREGHLDIPSTVHAIKNWLAIFLDEFAQIYRGTAPIGFRSPDEKFIAALETSLQVPILLTGDELEKRYQNSRMKGILDKWMREEQACVIRDDPEGIRENLVRASKFACYALVNKLVFHEALLKRYGKELDKISVPNHIDTGEKLRLHLESYFAKAKEATYDYETVFGEDHTSTGNLIPFYSDNAVPHWRQLINQIHDFDFSKLDYEVIGSIFERLISPEERHKFGQFYTRVEVVDLINSFCIQNGDEKVMDPACGGGTFLVRAYARKKELQPARRHRELLADLFGVDVDPFAAHLTTINLATRDLIDAENYPQISRSNFFDVKTGKTFVSLPKQIKTKGLGKVQHRDVEIPPLDAVVGNPPYLRQEEIPRSKNSVPSPGTKEYYSNLVKIESSAELSGRSDIHCYFWPHASSFLKDTGFLCLLTSSQWLDVEYGFKLQKWILKNFEIVAILESIDEPWFVGARVATAVTILKRQPSEKERMKNIVRFIQLRRPIREILAHDGTTAGAVSSANQFRDEILSLKKNTVTERYRARLMKQGDLWRQGVELSEIMSKSKESDEDADNEPPSVSKDYYGGKWGIPLRAPDLWFELLDKYGSRLIPLGKIADVRFGVKTGKDCFFYPIDHSAQCLQICEDSFEFHKKYGVSREEVEAGRVNLVLCGEGRGEIRPIEAKYLEPEVHNLMEIKGFTVAPEDCSRLILLVNKKMDNLDDKEFISQYIEWGIEKKVHDGSTCRSRSTEDREWYDLTGHVPGALFWPMAQQYKHAIPTNDANLICNHNLFDISPKEDDPSLLAGLLNSTWVVLSKYQFGRPVGVEGNLKTEVVDVKMMLVPDPQLGSERSRVRVSQAFNQLKQRHVLQFLSERCLRQMAYTQAGKEEELEGLSDQCELDMADRRELDDAVLEMLGVRSKKERETLIEELYTYLREFFEQTRQKEEKAILNKRISKRRGPAKPKEIAAQIYQVISENEPQLLRQYEHDFLDPSKPFDTYDIPTEGIPEPFSDMFAKQGVMFTKGRKKIGLIETGSATQNDLLILLANSGIRGLTRIPHEDDDCRLLLHEYERFILQRDKRLWELIEERTSDEDLQQNIYGALLSLLLQSRQS